MKTGTYEEVTRHHYRDPEVALAYHSLSRGEVSGPRGWMARIITYRERREVARILDEVQSRIHQRRMAAGRPEAKPTASPDAHNPGEPRAILEVPRAREPRAILDVLRAMEPLAILDVPCGAGKLAPIYKGRRARIVAADVSLPMLDLARHEFLRSEIAPMLHVADARNLPFADAGFDLVICLRLLHRVPEPIREDVVRELLRVSPPFALVSLAILDTVQRARLALRERVFGESMVLEPCSMREARRLFERVGARVVFHRPLLGWFSSEHLFLLEKT